MLWLSQVFLTHLPSASLLLISDTHGPEELQAVVATEWLSPGGFSKPRGGSAGSATRGGVAPEMPEISQPTSQHVRLHVWDKHR